MAKNQNKCLYKIGSPPPDGSKKEVLGLQSVNIIVIAGQEEKEEELQ